MYNDEYVLRPFGFWYETVQKKLTDCNPNAYEIIKKY